MTKISNLFEKYKKHFKAPQATVEKAASEAIKEVVNIDVAAEKIIYTPATKTLSLQIPSILKSELKFQYPKIIQVLERELGKEGAPKQIL